ncbi:hypothetical protein [Candidatus Electronema sp. PJ]|uniref:hypothetical protein n=1 Tax=Candidatus Electronema sp. PJ TaxID=3401572 RepID=UPI003AA98567
MIGIEANGKIICSTPPPSPDEDEDGCETAFAVGETTLNDPALGLNTNRWGWQITVPEIVPPAANVEFSKDIYAGAGGNDTNKGTKVGTLQVAYNGSEVNVAFMMDSGYKMNETHLYVGNVTVPTAAPGQYGGSGPTSDPKDKEIVTYTRPMSGAPVYVVAHAVVCGDGK